MEAPSRESLGHSPRSSMLQGGSQGTGSFSVWTLIVCLPLHSEDVQSAHRMHGKGLKDDGYHCATDVALYSLQGFSWSLPIEGADFYSTCFADEETKAWRGCILSQDDSLYNK